MPVLRIDTIKYSSFWGAIEHRCPKCGEEFKEKLLSEFRKIETQNGRKNLRKDASFFEIVISYEESKDEEAIKEDIRELLFLLEEYFGVDFNQFKYTYFIHHKKGRTHVHFLFTARNKEGKKIKPKPSQFARLKEEFLENLYPEDYKNYQKIKGKRIGVYPLWAIRRLENLVKNSLEVSEFVKLCRGISIPKARFVGLVMEIKTKEDFEDVLIQLREKLEEKKLRELKLKERKTKKKEEKRTFRFRR